MNFEIFISSIQDLFGSIEGHYGWMGQVISFIAIVLIFNFVVKWFLLKLHHKFQKHHRIWQDSFVCALIAPVSYFVWIFAITRIVGLLLTHFFSTSFADTLNILEAVGGVFCISWFLFRWKKNVIGHFSDLVQQHKIAFDKTRIDIIDKLATVLILFFTVLILLESTHRSLNTLIAFGGIGGLAIAFASQEVISNFFGGVMVYATQPFAKGDWIQVPERNIEGIVEDIGWYMTLIRSLDKRPIYAPNSIFTKAVVVTPSRMTHRRFKDIIPIRYADKPAIKTIMNDIYIMLESNSDVDARNSILVTLDSFDYSSLNILIQADLKSLDSPSFARAKDKILFLVSDILSKHNAELSSYCPVCSRTP